MSFMDWKTAPSFNKADNIVLKEALNQLLVGQFASYYELKTAVDINLLFKVKLILLMY